MHALDVAQLVLQFRHGPFPSRPPGSISEEALGIVRAEGMTDSQAVRRALEEAAASRRSPLHLGRRYSPSPPIPRIAPRWSLCAS